MKCQVVGAGHIATRGMALVSNLGDDCKPAWRHIGRNALTWAVLAAADTSGIAGGTAVPPCYAALTIINGDHAWAGSRGG